MSSVFYIKALESVTIFLPTIISILVVLNRRYYMKNLIQLKDKLSDFQTKTQNSTKSILDRLDQQEAKLSVLLRSRSLAEKVRQSTKNAIEYCGSPSLGKILTNSTELLICFATSLLQQGFGNQTKQQITARYGLARDKSVAYLKFYLQKQNIDQWIQMARPIVLKFLASMQQIHDDPINDKNNRFSIKVQDFAQEFSREFIKFSALLKKRGIVDLCHKRSQSQFDRFLED